MHDAGDRNHRIVVTLRHAEVLVPEDFRAATMTVEHGPQGASAVLLPIVAGSVQGN